MRRSSTCATPDGFIDATKALLDMSRQKYSDKSSADMRRVVAARNIPGRRRTAGDPNRPKSALEALRKGDYESAVRQARPTWAALPQEDGPGKIADKMRAIYEERLKLYKAQPPQPLR